MTDREQIKARIQQLRSRQQRTVRRTTMNETFETIREWAHGTFGVALVPRTVERAQEEFSELLEATEIDRVLEEAADVIITLCNLPGLSEAIQKKMEKNRARAWKVMGDGTGYHVKEA